MHPCLSFKLLCAICIGDVAAESKPKWKALGDRRAPQMARSRSEGARVVWPWSHCGMSENSSLPSRAPDSGVSNAFESSFAGHAVQIAVAVTPEPRLTGRLLYSFEFITGSCYASQRPCPAERIKFSIDGRGCPFISATRSTSAKKKRARNRLPLRGHVDVLPCSTEVRVCSESTPSGLVPRAFVGQACFGQR